MLPMMNDMDAATSTLYRAGSVAHQPVAFADASCHSASCCCCASSIDAAATEGGRVDCVPEGLLLWPPDAHTDTLRACCCAGGCSTEAWWRARLLAGSALSPRRAKLLHCRPTQRPTWLACVVGRCTNGLDRSHWGRASAAERPCTKHAMLAASTRCVMYELFSHFAVPCCAVLVQSGQAPLAIGSLCTARIQANVPRSTRERQGQRARLVQSCKRLAGCAQL